MTESKYNPRCPSVKRIMVEAKELRHPTELYHAQPLEDNIFEWHFTIKGPQDTAFHEGIYHGRILLPTEYPMKPPNIILLTPNGRFEVGTKICLSISAYHPEYWRPSWSIRTVLLALISFMPTKGEGAIGALDWTDNERKRLAKKSLTYTCPTCEVVNQDILPKTTGHFIAKTSKEEDELINNVAMVTPRGGKEPMKDEMVNKDNINQNDIDTVPEGDIKEDVELVKEEVSLMKEPMEIKGEGEGGMESGNGGINRRSKCGDDDNFQGIIKNDNAEPPKRYNTRSETARLKREAEERQKQINEQNNLGIVGQNDLMEKLNASNPMNVNGVHDLDSEIEKVLEGEKKREMGGEEERERNEFGNGRESNLKEGKKEIEGETEKEEEEEGERAEKGEDLNMEQDGIEVDDGNKERMARATEIAGETGLRQRIVPGDADMVTPPTNANQVVPPPRRKAGIIETALTLAIWVMTAIWLYLVACKLAVYIK